MEKPLAKYTCVNCGEVFYKSAGRPCKFCTPKCQYEHRAIVKRMQRELQKREKAKKNTLKSIASMEKAGRTMNYGLGDYGTAQELETLELIKVDVKERIAQIREGWEK